MFYGTSLAYYVFIIVSVFLFQNVNTSDLCVNICTNGTDCVLKARESVALVCDNVNYWYKGPYNTTLADTKGVVSEFKNQTKYDFEECNYEKAFIVLNLDSSDTGENIYMSKKTNASSFFTCKMSLYLYDNITNGYINFGDDAQSLNDTNSSAQIDSFTTKLSYDFQLEHLPLDHLYSNGALVKSSKSCTHQDYPWLNCLESEPLEIELKRCVNSYTLTFSYRFNNSNKYLNGSFSPLQPPSNITNTVNLKYPPKVKHPTVEKYFNETNRIVHLKCEVECGYPNSYTFTWFDLDGNVLSTSTDDEYKVTANETIDIYCHVSNTLNYTDLAFINESRTYFKIQQESTIKPTTNSAELTTDSSTLSNQTTIISIDPESSGLKDWEVAVIIVNCVLALVIIGGLLFYILVFRKKSTEKKSKKDLNTTTNSSNIYDNNENSNPVPNIAVRQNDLNENFVDNPVYGRNSKANINEIELDETRSSQKSESVRDSKNQTLV